MKFGQTQKGLSTIIHREIIPTTKKLEALNIPYTLGGSGMMYYYKLIQEVNDLDITVECPKNLLLKVFEEYEVIEMSSGDYPFASKYRISIPTLKLDVIGSFALHTETGIFDVPIKSADTWNGIRISCPEIWYVVYSLLGRGQKAKVILDYLRQNKMNRNADIIKELVENKKINEYIRNDLLKLIQ